jgi:hypothetical protein
VSAAEILVLVLCSTALRTRHVYIYSQR